MSDPNSPDRFNEEKATYAVRGEGAPDLDAGVAAIRNVLKTLPARPGVYRMQDARGDVLYVGKARALKARVNNYTQVQRLPKRLQRMVAQTRGMTIVTTNNEAEALLLEAQLIKRFRPAYNVLLRDDKSFPFILIRQDHDLRAHPAPSRRAALQGRLLRAVRGRGAGAQDAQCLAEIVPAAELHRQLLRDARPAVPALPDPPLLGAVRRANRRGRLCRAGERRARLPPGQVDPGAGPAGRGDAGGRRALDFEQAAVLRDRLKALTFIQGSQAINAEGVGDADIFALAHRSGGDGHPGLLHPRRAELGAPCLLPRAHP